MPLRALLHRWKRHVANERQGAVGRIGPWDAAGQEPYDFPLREKSLDRPRVRKVQRTKNQARRNQDGNRRGQHGHATAWLMRSGLSAVRHETKPLNALY